ncbi:MAG: hypothetical protein MJY92_03515 [Bacteroidales bacterium]|nr:hypothetical protein [Bacteroidales bacterium]
MKDIGYINRLDDKTLEALADDVNVHVPRDLSAKVNEALLAAALSQEDSVQTAASGRHRYVIPAALSFVCAAAVFASLHFRGYGQPEDTFDDPYLAYAAFEQAFSRVSGKVNDCARISSAADHAIELTSATMNRLKINE